MIPPDPEEERTVHDGSEPGAVVDAYHRAWTSGDVAGALERVADDVEVHAPDDRVCTKADWQQYLTAFVPALTGAPELTRLVAGDRVALWYYPQTAVTSTTLASELFTVRDGRIVAIRLVFDRLGYMPLEQGPS